MNKTFLKFGIIITVIFLFVCSFSISIKADDYPTNLYRYTGYSYSVGSYNYTYSFTGVEDTVIHYSITIADEILPYPTDLSDADFVEYSLYCNYSTSSDYYVVNESDDIDNYGSVIAEGYFVAIDDFTLTFIFEINNTDQTYNSDVDLMLDTTSIGIRYFDSYEPFPTRDYFTGWQDGFDEGLADGLVDGWQDGYDIGVDNAQNGMYDYGSAVYGFPESGSYDYFEGYDDGYTTGSGISIETFNLWPGVWDFMSGLFLIQLFPGLTIGALFGISITVPLAFWMLKFFKKG